MRSPRSVMLPAWRILRRQWPHLHGVTIGPVLDDIGWIRSAVENECVDANGNPIPWITYPTIAFLEPRIRPEFRVFEWGAGSSSMWWAARTAQVVAVEDDPSWAARVSSRTRHLDNVSVMTRSGDAYFEAPVDVEPGFQVVTIDGTEPRNRCTPAALKLVASDGVILWDNSERPSYAEGLQALADRGFRHVDFDGLTPLNNQILRTSILYRDANCLGL